MSSSRISLLFPCSDIETIFSSIRAMPGQKLSFPARTGILRWMDTFDWQLERHNASLMIHDSRFNSQFILFSPSTTFVSDEPRASTKWVNPGCVKDKALADHLSGLTQRALVPQATTTAAMIKYEFLNSEEMPATTLWLLNLGEIGVCGAILHTKRGHEAFGRRIERRILDVFELQDSTPIATDLFDVVLSMQNRVKKDYQSRFDLTLAPSTESCIAIAKALFGEQQRAVKNSLWIRDHPDPEFLHDLRVAMRRSASLLAVLGPFLAPLDVSWLLTELKKFIGLTSPVRDLENLGKLFRTAALSDSGGTAIGLLRSQISKDVEAAYGQLAQLIPSPRFEHLTASWARLARNALALSLSIPTSGTATGRSSGQVEPMLSPQTRVAVSAPVVLERSAASLLKKTRKARASMSPESLHTLRKQAKTLRYLLEFYESILEPASARQCIAGVKKLQDSLGQHQDSYVQSQLLEKLCSDYGHSRHELQPVFDILKRAQDEAVGDYEREIKHFSGRRMLHAIQCATGSIRK